MSGHLILRLLAASCGFLRLLAAACGGLRLLAAACGGLRESSLWTTSLGACSVVAEGNVRHQNK